MAQYSWSAQARYHAKGIMSDAILDCFDKKIGSIEAEYISPQEIIESLPSSLNINRYKHIIKHHSGQWEIRNKYSRCYFGFQVVKTRFSDTKSVLKSLIRLNSEQYRYDNDIYDDRFDVGDCDVCGNLAVIDARFDTHICRVNGYFKCYNYYCNGRTFKVGICLLDPITLQPPTRYNCANCDNPAKFIRYDLKEERKQMDNDKNGTEKAHRNDLCEACAIWGDCQLLFIQLSAIYKALKIYRRYPTWEWNEYGTGIIGSFTLPNNEYYNEDYHEFEVRPYVNCAYIKSHVFYAKQNVKNDNYRFYNYNHNKPQRKLSNRNSKMKKQQQSKSKSSNKTKTNKQKSGNKKRKNKKQRKN